MLEVRAETIQCPNCGAQLDPPELSPGRRSRVVKCAYCDRRVRFSLPAAPAPPAGHRGSGPPLGQGNARAVQVNLVRGARTFALVTAAIVLVIGASVVGLVISLSSAASELGEGLASVGRATEQGAALPVVCGDGETRSISGENLQGAGPVVRASGSCKLTISNANLRAEATVIEATGHAHVIVSNTNLTGGTAIAATERAVVTVENSTITGSAAAYTTSDRARVVAGDSNSISGPVKTAR